MKKLALLCSVLVLLTSCSMSKSEITGFTMGSFVTATAYGGDADIALTAAQEAENELSHKIENSTISQANGGKSVAVSSELAQALQTAKELCLFTGGGYNIVSLSLTSLWRFDSDTPVLPSEAEIKKALAEQQNGDYTVIDGVLTASGKIDPGSFGKGYACDKAVTALKEKAKAGIVTVGGSVGVFGTKNGGSAFSVAVLNPFGNGNIGVLTLTDRFISTSGDYQKKFTQNGVGYHHILDMASGYPVQNDLTSVTVVASNGALSDMLSTACFAMGLENGAELLYKYDAEALFINKNGVITATSGLKGVFQAEQTYTVNFLE